MTKKTTPPADIENEADVVEDVDTAETSDDVSDDAPAAEGEELYDATLTKTVKHAGEWHYPGAVFKGIGVDLAAALQAAGAADITTSEIA
ncbi:hypothetical protein AWN88_22585 [Agrobacterium tumefaciens]|nr:hypothetical protein AWN88_22585 [Agrobacterium tumefaciens]KAJ35059.1 hypothetical protein BW45_00150 [Agrobacterium tumefaciens]